MKKLSLIGLAILFFSTISYAQHKFMFLEMEKSKENTTFFDYQKAFDDYWGDKNIENGWYTDQNGNKQKAYGWKQFKRWENFWQTRVNPTTGEFPKTTASEQFQKHEKIYGKYPKGGDWQSFGPATSYSGYSGIGRINTVAFHPTDENTFWVGAPAGGLWATTDHGTTWTVLTDQNEVLGVSSIAVPTDYETSETIYIATGDRDANDNLSVGVLKTTDAGTTWQETGLSFAPSDDELVNKLLIHPANNNMIFASTSDGFYFTTDAAQTWTKTTTQKFVDFEFMPNNPTIIYGATRNGRLFKSEDSGQTWVEKFFSSSSNRLEIAVTQANPNIVYILAGNGNNGLNGVYKSNDQAENFNLAFDNYNLLGWSEYGSDSGGQAWYDLALAADPNDENILFAGGVNTWKSVDGGHSWSLNSHWYGGGGVQAVHADKHYLEYRPNSSTLFECNDGGIYVTENGEDWTDLTNGMIISQMYALGVAQTVPEMTITGLQDNGTKLWIPDSETWEDVVGGDGMECLIDFENENTQYGSLYYGQIYRTTNMWGNSVDISNNIPGGASGNWVTPYVLDPNDHNTIYIGYNQLWKSSNQGSDFESIGSFSGNLSNIAVSEANSDFIYVTNGSSLRKTTDGGTNWNTVTSGIPISESTIRYICIKNNEPNTAWVALSGYNQDGVYQTTDGGQTWTNISAGLPEIPVNCVIQNKLESAQVQLYAGTDYGVYIKNGEQDWTLYSDGLPNVVVSELEIYYDMEYPPNSRLRAATYGRGLWESTLELTGNYAPFVSTIEATNITENTATLSGEISNDFDSGVTESGFVYSTQPNPIIGGENVENVQTVPNVPFGSFDVEISNLNHATIYYYRAYATNENGTGYGAENIFSTNCETFSIQFQDGFESVLDFPNCWTQEFLQGEEIEWQKATGSIGGAIFEAFSGDFNMYITDNDLVEDKTILVSPVIDFSSGGHFVVSFQLAMPAMFQMQDELSVCYRETPESEWEIIATYNENLTDWTYKFETFEASSPNGQIGFLANVKNGRGISIDEVLVDISSTINDFSEEIRIFPNPTSDNINIQLGDNFQNYEILIYNSLGQKIHSQTENRNSLEIEMSEFGAGIYFLKIQTENKIYTQKIVVN